MVKIYFAQKTLYRGLQILQRPVFKFGHMTTFFGDACIAHGPKHDIKQHDSNQPLEDNAVCMISQNLASFINFIDHQAKSRAI